jgi:sugar phosphate isomerase/epimerase
MRIGDTHLTYCTNVHPGEHLPEVLANLGRYVAEVKALASPGAPFAVGVWLAHDAAVALENGALPELQSALREHDLYVPTLNGFPFGAFHGTRVKERVYEPDWRDRRRREHSVRLARILAQLLPDGVRGSISTLPGGYKPALRGLVDEERIAGALLAYVGDLHALERDTGKHIMLGLEPEPCCMLETIEETVAFFSTHLQDERAVASVAQLTGTTRSQAERLIPRHLGICLDACHAAVEFEDARELVAALRRAEIPIAKVQLSAGLRVPNVDATARAALADYAEDVYLHQVVAKRGDTLARFTDLPDALAAQPVPGEEWRIHFHVPVFAERLGVFESTQPFLVELLREHARQPLSDHLEVETYTWGVLPEALRAGSLPHAIERELRFCMDTLQSAPRP